MRKPYKLKLVKRGGEGLVKVMGEGRQSCSI